MSKKKTPKIHTVYAVFYEKNGVWYLRSIHKNAEFAVGAGFEIYSASLGKENQGNYRIEQWVLHT